MEREVVCRHQRLSFVFGQVWVYLFICFTRQSRAAKLLASELCRAARTTELLQGACTSLRSARIYCFTLCHGCSCISLRRELPGAAPTRAMGSPSQQLRLLGHLHPGVVPAPRRTPALGRAPGFAPNSRRRRLGSLLKEGLRSPVPLPPKERGVCRLWVLPPAVAGCQQDPCCRSGGSAFAVPRISRGLPSASAEHLNYLK